MNYQNNSNNGFGNQQPNQPSNNSFIPIKNDENRPSLSSGITSSYGLPGQQSNMFEGRPQGSSSFFIPSRQPAGAPQQNQPGSTPTSFQTQQPSMFNGSSMSQQGGSAFFIPSNQPSNMQQQDQTQGNSSFFIPSQQQPSSMIQNQPQQGTSFFVPSQQQPSSNMPGQQPSILGNNQSSFTLPSSTGTFAQFLQNQQQPGNSMFNGQQSMTAQQPGYSSQHSQSFLQSSLPHSFLNSYQTSLQSSSSQSKNQELLAALDDIESSYNLESPNYKFSHVFYNIVETPFGKPMNFPQELWNKYFIPNSPLMPVLLNKSQLDDRKKAQNALINSLAESRASIFKRLDSLKIKREMVRNKLENTLEKFRMKVKKYVMCDDTSAVYKLQVDFLEREKLYIRENKEEVVEYLTKMYNRLDRFDKKVSEAITNSERNIALTRELNRNN